MLNNDKKRIIETYQIRKDKMDELSLSLERKSVLDKKEIDDRVYGIIPAKNKVINESSVKPKVKTYTKKKFN